MIKAIEMEKDNLKATLAELAASCVNNKFHGISILSQKEGEKNAVAAMVNGNPVEIIIGIIKAMNSDRQVKAILEAAVEHQDLLNSSHVSAVDKLTMNFDKNKIEMSKYTAKQIAESDELFEKQTHKVRKFYLSRNPDKMMMLEERKAVVKERNKGLSPEYDKEYYCGTCGAKDGAEHPKSGYCFHCDTDNWISKNN